MKALTTRQLSCSIRTQDYISSLQMWMCKLQTPPKTRSIKGSTEQMAPIRLAEFEQLARDDHELPKQTLAILEGHIKTVRVAFDTGDWSEVDGAWILLIILGGRWTSRA